MVAYLQETNKCLLFNETHIVENGVLQMLHLNSVRYLFPGKKLLGT